MPEIESSPAQLNTLPFDTDPEAYLEEIDTTSDEADRIDRPGLREASELLHDVASNDDPVVIFEAKEREATVYGLVARLAARDSNSARLAVIRADLEDKDTATIAADRGTSLDGVRQLRYQGIKALRRIAAEQGITPDII